VKADISQKELEKKRVPPLQVQEHLLIPSDRGSTGLKGMVPNTGRYKAKCSTAPCRNHYLGYFDTPEDTCSTVRRNTRE
jgi:hypothetical protein